MPDQTASSLNNNLSSGHAGRARHIRFLIDRFESCGDADAMIWRGETWDYHRLLQRTFDWQAWLDSRSVGEGTVVALEGDFSPNAVAMFLALVEAGCILVPMTINVSARRAEYLETAEVEVVVNISSADEVSMVRRPIVASHPLYRTLRSDQHPGLVVFSSGSTGKCKAAVHDMVSLLEKFKAPRNALRTIPFLLYDHIGGINTMLYALANGGCLVTVQERSPDAVLAAVEQHGVELLPASPTFLNLILISEAWKHHDLSSLKTVSYGTEPMPESTLRRFNELFPQIRLLQTYGLSELGILRSKSRGSDSLWMRIGGEGFETRVMDGLLQIKARSAMLGYLNAASPFTSDGWYETGDRVELDGEWMRILGRESDIINVGGEKVYPAEVESVIQEMPGIAEAVVTGVANPITGMMVVARVTTTGDVERRTLIAALKAHCRARLQSYKVPVKVEVVTGSQHSDRFKKLRSAG